MTAMPSFVPSGGQPLLLRSTIQETFNDKLPNTSRYAWPRPREDGASSSASNFPSRSSKNPFFARHNPHPQRVRHMKGLLDIPVCTVIDSPGVEEDTGRFMVSTPTTDQMRQRPLKGLFRLPINSNAYMAMKEKAIPSVGLVPVTHTWREEMKKLMQAAKIKSNNNYTNVTAYQLPPGSRQGERPPPSRSGEALVPPSRDGQRLPPSRQASRQSERLMGRLGTRDGQRPPAIPEQQQYQHIVAYPDNEHQMIQLLGEILQTDSIHAIQSWLVCAPDKEKELVLDMIRAVSGSDRRFREGFNEAIRSPIYEDQLLQQESSLEMDEIKKYNEQIKNEEEEPKGKSTNEDSAKPRTPRSAGAQAQQYTQYEWTAPGNKPSSPFVTKEKKTVLIDNNKPRPGTAEAEIEDIRSRLQSRSSPRVFSHQQRGCNSRQATRPTTQQSLFVPPTEALERKAVRPPSHQSIKSQQSVIKSILNYKPNAS